MCAVTMPSLANKKTILSLLKTSWYSCDITQMFCLNCIHSCFPYE